MKAARFSGAACLALLCSAAMAQNPVSFQTQTNLVLVPVVVRDSHGRAIGNLTKDDFELFDKRKRQTIVSFSLVKHGSRLRESEADTNPPNSEPAGSTFEMRPAGTAAPDSKPTNASPERFVIYLFDDLNVRFADMAAARAAVVQHFRRGLAPTDRAAIYTFSGSPTLEFTNDRDKLENAVTKLRERVSNGHDDAKECPDVSYYLADLILNKDDENARQAAIGHVIGCMHLDNGQKALADSVVMAAANRELLVGEQNYRVALRALRRAIRRLAEMPGERLIVLASPGYFVRTSDAFIDTDEVLKLAAKAHVTISGLDVRGLYTGQVDASVSNESRLWQQYHQQSEEANKDVMMDLTQGTGGVFFHNNDDLKAGFDRLTNAPEFSYILAFSPTNLNPDGSFHSIKVRLLNQKGMTVEARRGYYASKREPEEQAARAEVDDAVFSRDQTNGIPVILQTGYVKPNAGDPEVTVLAKVEVKSLHFQKSENRNRDSLIMVSALFDADGGYVTGTAKTVSLRLRDETLGQAGSGITLRWEFKVKPGTYVIRLVVRESQSKAMTTFTRPVTIPRSPAK